MCGMFRRSPIFGLELEKVSASPLFILHFLFVFCAYGS